MSRSALHDLCIQPTLIASTEKYKQLVHDSTAELVQPIQCILSALDRRSMALSKCDSYDAALRDADVMQQFSPSSAMGYLRAVNIYSEQGKQQQVIDICNKAMHMVDTKDPDYTNLQQAKVDAEQRQNIRIDFIMQLPVEVVFTALIPMLMKENTLKASKPCEYLNVSNQWRDRILQYFGDLQFRIDDEHSVILNRCPQLFQLAQYIKALNISSYTKGRWLVDLIRDYHFSSLRKIEIELGNGVGLHFISALKLVSSTLTHVEIYLYYGPKLSLASILLICPNLVWLKMEFPSDIDLSQVPTMAKLETLVLVNEEGINYDQTIEIYKRFPSLKTLKLAVCSDFESALVVSDYRPSMKCRQVQMTTYCLELSFSGQGGTGDEHLSIEFSLVSALTQQNAIVILNKYQGSLQHIYWSIEPDSNDDMYSIQYPQLKKLYLYESGWWIPRNAPMLEELSITSKTIRINSAVLDTIPPNLKKLELRLDYTSYRPDKTALARYIHSFSQQSQLQHIDISIDSHDNTQDVLDAICRLHQLRRLSIRFIEDRHSYAREPMVWNSHAMEQFLDTLSQSSSQLSCLEIRCKNAPSSYSINALKRLGYLKQFAFSIDGIDDDYSFWNAIQTLPQLETISIYPTSAVKKDDINFLIHHRPSMKIIIRKIFRPF